MYVHEVLVLKMKRYTREKYEQGHFLLSFFQLPVIEINLRVV